MDTSQYSTSESHSLIVNASFTGISSSVSLNFSGCGEMCKIMKRIIISLCNELLNFMHIIIIYYL